MLLSKSDAPYYPQLDTIRAFAVIFVVLSHWIGGNFLLSFGWVGVDIFFVLSGFLITNGLLKLKFENNGLVKYLKKFFVKRIFRIFPLYFFYILLVLLFELFTKNTGDFWLKNENIPLLETTWIYLFTFTLNLKLFLIEIFKLHSSSDNFFGHFWSLSLEEQFYLIFPFIVYYTSVKNINKILLFFIILIPILRLLTGLYAYKIGFNSSFTGNLLYFSPIYRFDVLAWGALLAVVNPKNIKNALTKFIYVALFSLILGIIMLYFFRLNDINIAYKSLGFDFPGFWLFEKSNILILDLRYCYGYSLLGILFFYLVACGVKEELPKWLFNNKYLIYIGKISYSIYVFHLFILFIIIPIITKYLRFIKFPENIFFELLQLIVYLIVLIIISGLSFKYIEDTFLKIKYRNASK